MKDQVEKRIGISIKTKTYLFVIVVVLAVAMGVAAISYRINARQIDAYYKQVASDTARNFASVVDAEYVAKLREAVESDEYQKLREEAEANEDEASIENWLKKKNLWGGYERTRSDISEYLGNMSSVKYLYVVACNYDDYTRDMYLIDSYDEPAYETGYFEDRETAFLGVNLDVEVEPTISTGDWGWLCSAYTPVKDSSGKVVCTVGCDFGMDEVMKERRTNLLYVLGAAILLTLFVLASATAFVDRIIVRPLNGLTNEMKRFRPTVGADYETAGVANLDIRSGDEINVLYDGVRTMEMNIVDYLNDLDSMQRDKERAEADAKSKEKKIEEVSRDAYRDSLTGVGSKAAFAKKTDEMNEEIKNGRSDVGIVMVDMNDLKMINDKYGHKMGDAYIKGCCKKTCDAFKRSPVYRIGGDEFVAVLTGQDYESRFEKVESLRAEFLASHENEDAKPWERYSAAVGMAELSSDDATMDLILRRADKSMYENKKEFKERFGSYR